MNENRYAFGAHFVPVLAPVDLADNDTAGQFVKAGNYNWVQFLVSIGNINDTSEFIRVQECTSNSTTGATLTEIPFRYRKSAVVATDTLGALTTADTAGITVAATDDNVGYVIDVDPRDLTENYQYVRLYFTNTDSQTACLASAWAVLHPRYAQGTPISSS